jgi:hypothetical protein
MNQIQPGGPMSFSCATHPKYHTLVHKIFPAVMLLWLMFAPAAASQENGYSYLRMDVDGHTISNFVPSEKYSRGWLEVEIVEVERQSSANHSDAKTDPQPYTLSAEKVGDGRWITLSSALRSGRIGPGKLRFGAGDSGGMEPLFDAKNHKSVIPQAELDFYAENTDKFVGRFKIKSIRILSLEDMPASACGAYVITLSFQSIAKE